MNEDKEIIIDEKDINFNKTECLTSYDSFGTTHYVNVCNNATKDVPWGFGGYSVFLLLLIFAILIVTVIISLFVLVIKD